MHKQDFNPSFDDLMNDNRILYRAADFWKVNMEGVPHRQAAGYNGEKWTVKVPDLIPMKHKGRKLAGLVVWFNAFDFVTAIEAHYGTGGRVLAFTDNDVNGTFTQLDVTARYRALQRKM